MTMQFGDILDAFLISNLPGNELLLVAMLFLLVLVTVLALRWGALDSTLTRRALRGFFFCTLRPLPTDETRPGPALRA